MLLRRAKWGKYACNLICNGTLTTQWVNLEKLVNPFDTLEAKRTDVRPLWHLLGKNIENKAKFP
jgi:hypothetical protein